MIYTKETDISCGLEENVSKSKMGLFYKKHKLSTECVVDTQICFYIVTLL